METMIYVLVVTDVFGNDHYGSHDSIESAKNSACFMMQTERLEWEKVWLDEQEVSYLKSSSFMGQTAKVVFTNLNKKY